MPEIWKRAKNVVPLQRQSEDRRALIMRDNKAGCRPPDVTGRKLSPIPCKTHLSTMAKIIYEVKQNQNSYSAAFGKWYAQIKNLETLNTRKLANHRRTRRRVR